MKNKGFTLVEMLAVIALLAIIGTITAVSVKNIKKNQDEENKLNIISAIMTGARNYITEKNIPLAPNGKSTDYIFNHPQHQISLKDLKNGGYVDFDVEKYPEYYFTKKSDIEKYQKKEEISDSDIRWTYGRVCGNNLKYEIIYDYFGWKSDGSYGFRNFSMTDCGCLEQSGRDKSFKLCENSDNNGGKTCGWDTNGIYSCTDGTTDTNKNLNEDKEKGRSN